MRWQPIETAPKDGTHVLLRYYKGGKSSRTWVSGVSIVVEAYYNPPRTNKGTCYDGSEYTLEIKGSWVDALGRLILEDGTKAPKNVLTHWMPLPDAPTDESQEEA